MVITLWAKELGVYESSINYHLKKGKSFNWVYEYIKNNQKPKDYGKAKTVKAIVKGKVMTFESIGLAGLAFGVKKDLVSKYCKLNIPVYKGKLKGIEFSFI